MYDIGAAELFFEPSAVYMVDGKNKKYDDVFDLGNIKNLEEDVTIEEEYLEYLFHHKDKIMGIKK